MVKAEDAQLDKLPKTHKYNGITLQINLTSCNLLEINPQTTTHDDK
jgi:hypothetical protein